MQTPFTAELVSEATRIIYRAIAATGQAPRLGTRPGRERPRPASRSRPTLATSRRGDPRTHTTRSYSRARDTPTSSTPSLWTTTSWTPPSPRPSPGQRRSPARSAATGRSRAGFGGYRWYDEFPCIIGVYVQMRRGTQTHASTRKTRRAGEHPFRGPVDEIELELLVKRTGQGVPGKVRIPASAALLSPEGGGTSEIEPVFVARRDAPIHRSALCSALTEAYSQPSFDNDADSIDAQMGEYRRRIAYLVTELLQSREAADAADLRELVTTCILPSVGGDSNIDIQIRNGALATIHRA